MFVSPAYKREYKEPNGNLTAECAEDYRVL